MNQHWPMLVAIGFISLAAAFGIIQQNQAAIAVIPQHRPRTPQAARPTPEAPIAPAPAAVTQTPTPAVADQAFDGLPPAVAEKPVQPRALPLPDAAPPKVLKPQVLAADDAARQALLDRFKHQLEANFATPTTNTGDDGGFAITLEGARLEVKPVPNWHINIYNINPHTPDVETGDFRKCLNFSAATLGIDLKQAANPGEKVDIRTTSQLGSVALKNDPEKGICIIMPLQKKIVPGVPGAVKQAPPPVAPVPVKKKAGPADPAAAKDKDVF